MVSQEQVTPQELSPPPPTLSSEDLLTSRFPSGPPGMVGSTSHVHGPHPEQRPQRLLRLLSVIGIGRGV